MACNGMPLPFCLYRQCSIIRKTWKGREQIKMKGGQSCNVLNVMPSTLEKPVTLCPVLSVSVIQKLPDSTPDHICRQFETAYQLVVQSRQTSGLNIRYPPTFHPRPSSTESFASVYCIPLLRKATVIWPKVYIFVSFHLYMS